MYTAISYCAGDPKHTRVLVVNGLPFNAFANLLQAIEETCFNLLDSGRNKNEKVSVWVDQICINQSDPQERAEQVNFMYEIYQSALNVAVCLTTHEFAQDLATRQSDRAIRCIEQVHKDVPHLVRFLASAQDSCSETWKSVSNEKEETSSQLNTYLQAAVEDEDFALGWLDVQRMRRMPWFSRAWVLQEYASHQDVVFLFAWQHIVARKLAAVLLAYLWRGKVSTAVEQKMVQIHGDLDALSTNSQRAGPNQGTNPSSFSSDQNVYNTLKSKSYISQQRRPLIDLLDHSRMAIASDKRDHIYSCLGLAEQTYGIRPYYGQDVSVEDLFTNIMRLLLLNTKDINLIERASTAFSGYSETLPSWVPDWRRPITLADAKYYYDRYDKEVHTIGESTAHIMFLGDGKILETKGVLMDSLVGEVEVHVWCGKRIERIYTLRSPQNVSSLPHAHVETWPPRKGDEVWKLCGSNRLFLLRKDGERHVFLRGVHVSNVENMEIEHGGFTESDVNLERQRKTLWIH
ncbi:hypothetical protein HBI48_114030 [Parastagonospora nodorum]|nr:hypothetical protein HBI48_114030 [Parastagonospora nodorum]KAH6227132.1 hypothetical protein HBI15_092670 [Parastagonospora nodorum]